ncbi:MAG: hypothetical protein RDA78_16580 [Roseibium sp.]|uniref:hypothetical protein n=1 Tax=Roseibium sp. TaxID=1936156 RepID=UPI003D9C1E1C
MDVGPAGAVPASTQALKSEAYTSNPTAPGQTETPESKAPTASSTPAAPPPGLGETVDIQA